MLQRDIDSNNWRAMAPLLSIALLTLKGVFFTLNQGKNIEYIHIRRKTVVLKSREEGFMKMNFHPPDPV